MVVRSTTADPIRHKPMPCTCVNPLNNIPVGPLCSPSSSHCIQLPKVLDQLPQLHLDKNDIEVPMPKW